MVPGICKAGKKQIFMNFKTFDNIMGEVALEDIKDLDRMKV